MEIVEFLKSLEGVTPYAIFVAIIIFQWYVIKYQLKTNKEEMKMKDEKLYQVIEDFSELTTLIKQLIQEIQIALRNNQKG